MHTQPVPVRRPPWWLVAVLLVVALGAGVGAGALVWAGAPETVPRRTAYDAGFPVLTPEQYARCLRQATVNFDGADADRAMRSAAAELRDDDRYGSVRARTREQTYAEFLEVFADQPELVDGVRPEAMPASVLVLVRRGDTAEEAKGPLGARFPEAEVTAQESCPRP